MQHFSIDYAWLCIVACILHGLCVDYAWIEHRLCYAGVHGLFMSHVWITPGVCMDNVCSFQSVLISEALQYADSTRMVRGWCEGGSYAAWILRRPSIAHTWIMQVYELLKHVAWTVQASCVDYAQGVCMDDAVRLVLSVECAWGRLGFSMDYATLMHG